MEEAQRFAACAGRTSVACWYMEGLWGAGFIFRGFLNNACTKLVEG